MNANTSKIKRADSLFSMIVRLRDGACKRCGASVGYDNLEAHHLIKRDKHATRFVLDNGVAVCKWLCHHHLETHPDDNEAFAIELLGEARWNELLELSRLRKAVDLDAVIVELREQVAA